MRLAFALLVACGPALPPAATPAAVVAKRIEAPPGVTIDQACTATGPELCFNATDDNCNGVIDEGCGQGTGPLQFAISWGDSPADLDLIVTDPSGERTSSANPRSQSGMHLDRDCPSEGCYSQNTENIFFEEGEPPRGRWRVEIALTDLKDARSPVRVRFGARIGSRSYAADVEVSRSDERKTFVFDL